MFGLFKKKSAPITEVLMMFRPSNRDISWKVMASLFKKAAPSVTDEELDLLRERLANGDNFAVRLTKKGSKVLADSPLVRNDHARTLVDFGGDHCRCGNTVCGDCTLIIKESVNYSATNIGIIPDDTKNVKIPKELREDW